MRNFIMAIALGTACLALAEPAPVPVSYAVPPVYQLLRYGEIKPTGWILEQMRRDLKDGFAGHYDEVAPEARTNVFGGELVLPPGRPDFTLWWDGETQGRWRKGLAMLAYLSDDEAMKKKVDAWFDHILKTQDADGYLGVYKPGMRYHKIRRELCDLGSQAYLFKAMAAYVDLSGREDVLKSLVRGVDRTLAEYADGKKHVFPDNTHNLLFLDVLDWLYARTGEAKYPQFAEWLFMDYTHCPDLNQLDGDDSRITWLLDPQKPFCGHGPHTISHLSMPWFLYHTTGNRNYRQAGLNALVKLQPAMLPGGVPVSQEFIVHLDPRKEIARDYSYEYCSILSLMESDESILRYQGDANLGDAIEKAWFNGGQAGRLPGGEAISYMTTDTRGGIPASVPGKYVQTSLAPDHVPACCNPSATQVSGQYVRGMWMRTPADGLVAMLYGPCILKTTVAGIPVTIDEQTLYPFGFAIKLVIHPEKDVVFPLSLRSPGWSTKTEVTCPGATISRQGDYVTVSKKWHAGDTVTISFSADVQTQYCGTLAYLSYGPLVFAQPIPAKGGKPDFGSAVNFKPQGVQAESPEATEMLMFVNQPGTLNFGFTARPVAGVPSDLLRPFDAATIVLEGNMLRQKDGKAMPMKLVPIGCGEALLRRVAFPVSK